MKRIIILLLIALPVWTKAQLITNWKDITDDSVGFVKLYGSVDEYNYQHASMHGNNINFMMHFIDARPTYTLELAKWLVQEQKCGDSVWTNATTPKYFICGNKSCPPAASGKYTVKPLIIKCHLTNKNRVESVMITGNAKTLMHLFSFYWIGGKIKPEHFKKGSMLSMDSLDDHIKFDWRDAAPFITITRNPDMTYFSKNIPMDN